MSIQYADVLHTIAEVSITLAGFVGVILVLRNNSPLKDRVDANSMFHMLLSSLGVCGVAFLPLIVQSFFDDESLVWRTCIPVMGLLHLVGASKAMAELRGGEIGLPKVMVGIFAPVSMFLVVASIAVAAGYWVVHAPAFYLAGLGWSLLVAATSFLMLVFRQDGTGDA